MNPYISTEYWAEVVLHLILSIIVILWVFGIRQIPRTTLAGIIIQLSSYAGLIYDPWNSNDMCTCISAQNVMEHKNFWWFLTVSLERRTHGRIVLFIIFFIAFGGIYLESMYGSINLALLIVVISLGSNAMYVFLSWIAMQITGDDFFYTSCSMGGFIAVLLATLMISRCEESVIEKRLAVYARGLFYSATVISLEYYLFVDNNSMVFHIGGIFVGLIYNHTIVGTLIDYALFKISGRKVMHNEFFNAHRPVSYYNL